MNHTAYRSLSYRLKALPYDSARANVAQMVLNNNLSIAYVAGLYGISPSTVRRYLDWYTEHGNK